MEETFGINHETCQNVYATIFNHIHNKHACLKKCRKNRAVIIIIIIEKTDDTQACELQKLLKETGVFCDDKCVSMTKFPFSGSA